MKLVSFSVKNYRSITNTEKIKLSNLTVLSGPNNEGKSNILKGLTLAMNTLSNYSLDQKRRKMRLSTHRSFGTERYDWLNDFPIQLQRSDPKGKTEFKLSFQFDDDEKNDFFKKIKSNIVKEFNIKITLNRQEYPLIEILQQGKAKAILNKKTADICDFISKKFTFHSIKAVRSTKESIEQIQHLVGENLRDLEENPSYLKLMYQIKKLQEPIFQKTAKKISDSMKVFLPEIRNVMISLNSKRGRIRNYGYSSEFDITIDDGVETDISFKGDGVKSLAAISLIHSSIEKQNKDFLLAIEEPEAHLHSGTIHKLKKIVKDISNKHQVIITTHSPILIDTENISNNVLVRKNKASIAKSIEEIRNILGVRAPDNLISAEMVLFVEGKSDERIFKKVLSLNRFLKKALNSGKLKIENLHGANKLKYLLKLYKEVHLTKTFFILDNEYLLKKEVTELKKANLINGMEYRFAERRELKESELEDLFSIEDYKQEFANEYGIDLTKKEFKKGKEKWSERMKKIFSTSGVPFEENEVKKFFADSILKKIGIDRNKTLKKSKDFFESLIKTLNERLK